MLLTVILLSGAVLASTSLAGLLILYQLRQATDTKSSMQAIFAADTGIEWAFYNENKRPISEREAYPKTINLTSTPSLSNGATATITKSATDALPIKSIGQSGRSARAFQGNLPPQE